MRKGNNGEKRENGEEKTDENSGHYIIASRRQPERRPLERRTLVPIYDYDKPFQTDLANTWQCLKQFNHSLSAKLPLVYTRQEYQPAVCCIVVIFEPGSVD